MKNHSYVTLNQMIKIIHKTINSVDKRLLNHGERVSYIMLNLLKAEGSYSEEEILKICIVSIFHDIGIYKVTERNKLVQAEVVAPFNHAIYGALFIKYFSPLSEFYKIVLTHHFTIKYYRNHNIEVISKEGLLLNLADYVDRIDLIKKREINYGRIESNYLEKHITLFKQADKKFDFMNKLKDGRYKHELDELFENKILDKDKIIAYSKMLAYTIDFRSESTLIHTITVEAISEQLAKTCRLDNGRIEMIMFAAVIHDIGKIAIPIEILEKPDKLTEEEFEIMKSHAKIGYDILSELNIDDIRDIATLHHEKLNGNGYPFGIKDTEISTEMRIVTISDIISALCSSRSYKKSFSKEKIIEILSEMVEHNEIDKEITNLFIENYDYIIHESMR